MRFRPQNYASHNDMRVGFEICYSLYSSSAGAGVTDSLMIRHYHYTRFYSLIDPDGTILPGGDFLSSST